MTSRLLTVLLLFCSSGLTAPQSAPNKIVPLQPPNTGSLVGTVTDSTGAAIPRAQIAVVPSSSSSDPGAETITGASGSFSLSDLHPDSFSLTIAAPGFTTLHLALVISPGQTKDLGSLTLVIAPLRSNVKVTLTNQEMASGQIKQEEQQRLFGVLPNYFVTYLPDAAPLTPKQKFELTWKFTLDPSAFAVTGAIAGLEQAVNGYAGYGQGAQGFGKRYGAAYADFAIANVLGSAVLPSLFNQDPRYFVKGTGSVRFRFLYAVSKSVVRKGDNRRWQPDYSSILGNLGAGAISNLYYPAKDRNGAAVTFQNAGIGIAAAAAADVLQEFFFRKITPKTLKGN